MTITRRELLAGAGGLATAAVAPIGLIPPIDIGPFPARDAFAIPKGIRYLNSAYIHPISRASAAALQHYAEQRLLREERRTGDSVTEEIKRRFAGLINASPAELSLIPNTSTGENLVVQGLAIASNRGNVVTDALHFDGSLVLYGELQRRGLDLRVVPHRDWRIELADMAKLVDRNTRLVSVSLVSWYNGFQHDLKAVCDLAHAHGALVYCDIVQGAGATPLDVRATGVDFCACSSFKWLMGDFGLGFLYCREELLDRLPRTIFGYQQATAMDTHYLPGEGVQQPPVSWTLGKSASAHFEAGSFAQAPGHALARSLEFIEKHGVAAIEAWRQPLLRRLEQELPRLGFASITPSGSRSALMAFTRNGLEAQYGERLRRAGVVVSVGGDRMRVSPSVFNEMGDVDALLTALS